jgi:large subunit ribosomal protein L3
MSRLFLEDGESIPVTAVSVCGNFIADIKTSQRDGYNAFVVSKVNKSNNINKSKSEFFKKINIEPGILAEFRASDEISDDFKIGKHLTADVFEVGQYVDVTGTSKGKGYAGVIKRHNFAMQDATHGNSLSHRAPGSIGQCQTPGRVWKGKKMAGHMGSEKVTIQNLKIISIDLENSLILIQGSIPGSTGSRVILRPARGENVEFPFEETQPEETQPEEKKSKNKAEKTESE